MARQVSRQREAQHRLQPAQSERPGAQALPVLSWQVGHQHCRFCSTALQHGRQGASQAGRPGKLLGTWLHWLAVQAHVRGQRANKSGYNSHATCNRCSPNTAGKPGSGGVATSEALATSG